MTVTTNQPKIPVIPAEVADAIEWKRNRSDGLPKWTNEDFIEAYLRGIGDTQKKLRMLTFDTLMTALINGYTREKTAEELAEEERQQANDRILRAYNVRLTHARFAGHNNEFNRHTSFADGIKFTLNELGVKIEGVNA